MAKNKVQSVANSFLDIYARKGKQISLIGLMKRVYITLGIYLVYIKDDKERGSFIDPMFDKRVEAWRFGPVIPSLYHELKHFGSWRPIPPEFRCGIINPYTLDFEVSPLVYDEKLKSVINAVFSQYENDDDDMLIRKTHGKGTPWEKVYKEGENNEIPEKSILEYYEGIVSFK